jgi:hypothetical protein
MDVAMAKRIKGRWGWISAALAAGALAAVIASAPWILSSDWGREYVLRQASRWAGGRLEVESWTLRWQGPQVMENVRFTFSGEQTPLATCKRIAVGASLWSIVRHDLGQVELTDPKLCLQEPLALAAAPQRPVYSQAGTAHVSLGGWEPPYTGDFRVSNGTVEALAPGVDPILFTHIALDLRVRHGEPIHLLLSGRTEPEGEFRVASTMEGETWRAQAQIVKLPVKGMDQIAAFFQPDLAGLLIEGLGPSLDLSLQAESAAQALDLQLHALSPRLALHAQILSEGGIASLKGPATLALTPTPLFCQKILALAPALHGWTVLRCPSMEATVEAFSLPLTDAGADLARLAFRGAVTATDAALSAPEIAQPVTVAQARVEAAASPLAEGLSFAATLSSSLVEASDVRLRWDGQWRLEQPAKMHWTLPGKAPIDLTVATLLLPAAWERLSLEGSLQTAQLFSLANVTARFSVQTVDNLRIDLQAEGLRTALQGGLKDGGRLLRVTEPLSIDYTLSPAVASAWLPSYAALSGPTRLQLTLDPFALPLSMEGVRALALKGKGEIDKIAFSLAHLGAQAALTKVALSFQADGKAGTAQLNLAGEALLQDTPAGAAALRLSVSRFDPSALQTASLEAAVQLRHLSTAFVEAWIPRGTGLAEAIGPDLNLDAVWRKDPAAETFSLKTESRLLTAHAAFSLKDQVFQLLKGQPASLNLTLTEKGYAWLDRLLTGSGAEDNPFLLQEPAQLSFSLSRLNWPLAGGQPDVDGKGSVGRLAFVEKSTGQVFALENAQLTAHASPGKPLSFQLGSGVVASSSKDGRLEASGTLDPALFTQPQASWQDLDLSLALNMQKFPSLLVDALARILGQTDYPCTALFGHTLNAALSMQLEHLTGPVSLNINAPNSRVALSGALNKGVLTLSAPLHAQITMTDDLSHWLLKDFNPFSISRISAQAPLTLEVAAAGFSLPLYPFSAVALTIPQARIELGKISARNEGNLKLTLGLLKSKQFSKDQDLTLWFAPIDLHIKKGIVDWERTEILVADTYEVALWGKIDLPKEYVDMILGLTAQCLKAAFGIRNLPENYVLHIPMRGPADNVRIDTGGATTKVALLLAWQQKALAGSLGGAPGALFGGLLDAMGPLPDKDAKAPPAKHPFPWEEGGKKGRHTSHADRKRAIKKGEKPLKQLMKVIG